jgi:hypothetical protein
VKAANKVIDTIDAANNVLESADKIAEKIGIEDKDLK